MAHAARARVLREHTPEQRAIQLESYWKEANDNVSAHTPRRNGRGREVDHGLAAGLASQRGTAGNRWRIWRRGWRVCRSGRFTPARWSGPLRRRRQSGSRTASSRGPMTTWASFMPANGRASRSPIWIAARIGGASISFAPARARPGGELMIETQARMVRQVQALARGACGRNGRDRQPRRSAARRGGVLPGHSARAMLRFEISPASVSVLELSEWTLARGVRESHRRRRNSREVT